jgi:hypothetical protein
MRGREMTGFLNVDDDHLDDDESIERWIAIAERYVSRLKDK